MSANVNDGNADAIGSVNVLEEVVDLGECAKRGEHAGPAKGYRVRVRGELVTVDHSTPTGRHLLELAGLVAEEWTLRVKVVGERPRVIELDEEIDLCGFLIESFKAIPRDTTDGKA